MTHVVEKSYTLSGPTQGDVHVNTPLINFSMSVIQSRDNYISMNGAPNLPVPMRSDRYYVYDRAAMSRDQAEARAPGAETAGGGYSLSKDTFYCEVYGFHADLAEMDANNQDPVLDLERSHTEFVTDALMLRRERAFMTEFMGENIWNNGTDSPAAAAAGNFKTNTGDPVERIRAALTAVHEFTGFRPTDMVISRKGYDALIVNDDIKANITGGSSSDNPAILNRVSLAALFELKRIHVIDSVYNKAGPGTADFGYVSDDLMLLVYRPDTVTRQTATGFIQFSWNAYGGATDTGLRIKKWYSADRDAVRIEGEMSFDYKVTASEMGWMFKDASL